MNRERVGEVLKECRKRAGLTQQKLALRLHIDQGIISKVETGAIIPSYVLVKEWARATNGEDLIALDLSGDKQQGWRKLRELENAVREVKSKLETVVLLRKKA